MYESVLKSNLFIHLATTLTIVFEHVDWFGSPFL